MNASAQLPTNSAIMRDREGKYNWVYEVNLWKNPSILITLLKIFGGIMLGLFVFFGILDVIEGSTSPEDILTRLRFDGILLAIILGLALLGYAVYAIMMGGKYCALFIMDEEGIEHRQMPKEVEKAQLIGALNLVAGLATGNVSQAGIGILSAARDSASNSFDSVNSIKGIRAFNTIKVNSTFMKNQIYVEAQDYDFVYGFITARCPNAKIK